MPEQTSTAAHRAPVPPALDPRGQHGRRCACPECHNAISVTASEGVAAIELLLRSAATR